MPGIAERDLQRYTDEIPGRPRSSRQPVTRPLHSTELGDDDGVVFIASGQAGEILTAARQIAQAERDSHRFGGGWDG